MPPNIYYIIQWAEMRLPKLPLSGDLGPRLIQRRRLRQAQFGLNPATAAGLGLGLGHTLHAAHGLIVNTLITA